MTTRRRGRIIIPKKSKIAFVCSGGAVKAGAFHLGVAWALQEKGFKFSGGLKRGDTLEMNDNSGRTISIYVGASAGSIISTYFATGYSLDAIFDSFLNKKRQTDDMLPDSKELKRMTYRHIFSLRDDMTLLGTLKVLKEGASFDTLKKLFTGLTNDSIDTLFKWKWLKWPGLFSTAGLEKYLKEEVLPSNDFQAYVADLYIVATQLNHSRKVVFGKNAFSPPDEDKTVSYVNTVNISEACAASTALPFVFAPFPIKNERGHIIYYFDGEIRDTLSTHVAHDAGADLIFASYTHQPYHFVREVGSLHEHGIPTIMIQALYLLIEQKIQTVINVRERNQKAIEAVSDFFKFHNLSDTLRKQCIETLEAKLGFKTNVDCVYIRPKATDHQMFFGDHFNLSAAKTAEIVRSGFRSAIDTLRRYEFE